MHTVEYLGELKRQHAELDKEISEAYNNYASDDELNTMKHKRLLLKDEIKELENRNGKNI